MILILCFLLSFSFDWEGISNTRDSVKPQLKTPQRLLQPLCYVLCFQLFSQCLEM